MKIRKTAEQKNVVLNNSYYTIYQINEMLEKREITYFDEHINECYEPIRYYEMDEKQFRIFTEDLKEIKVMCIDGHYTTVAVGNNDKVYYISL